MGRQKNIHVVLFGIFLLSGACLNLKKPQNKIEFYTLEYESPQITGHNPLPFAVRVEGFGVAPAYDTHRIIYREGSFQRDSYVYHRWRANPADMVTYFLRRDIRQSGLFKAVLPRDSGFPSSHVIEGTVDEFFESDSGETWEAVLALSVVLMAENEPDVSRRILFQKTYRTTKPCNHKHPVALAGAMSQAMGEISSQIIKDVYDRLKDSHRKKVS